jgi:membrane-associated phospholipid phosphatase
MIKNRRNGLWLRILFASLIFIAGCANSGPTIPEKENTTPAESGCPPEKTNSNQTVQSEDDSNEPLWLKAAKEDFAKWPRRLLDDSKETFTRPDNITALLLAGAASAVMDRDADKRVADYFDRHQKLRNFKDESLNVIGHPTTHFAAGALWYFISAQNHDDFNRERAWTMRNALTITWLATTGLKLIRNNETPNGKNFAWPSGHTSSSFTVASVLDEFYGPKVGIPAYAVASLVAYRMIDTDDHWASDVVFGATLGWVVGHTVAGKHKELEVAGFQLVPFIPITEEPAIGIGLIKKF